MVMWHPWKVDSCSGRSNIPHFKGAKMIGTMFTKIDYWNLSWATWSHFSNIHPQVLFSSTSPHPKENVTYAVWTAPSNKWKLNQSISILFWYTINVAFWQNHNVRMQYWRLTWPSGETLDQHASFLSDCIPQQHALLHELPVRPFLTYGTDMKPLDTMQTSCSIVHEQGWDLAQELDGK